MDGAAITHRSTIGEINHDKKGTSFDCGYVNGIYKYSVGEFDVWLEYGHDRSPTTLYVDDENLYYRAPSPPQYLTKEPKSGATPPTVLLTIPTGKAK